jgi:7-cyano-7-deazaguanine reductase
MVLLKELQVDEKQEDKVAVDLMSSLDQNVDNMALKALGVSAEKNKELYNFNMPDIRVLERFPTPKGHAGITIHVEIPEFSSLCPITGQPDWAAIVIDYSPDEWCVESKSLKLYKEGFRNFGEFHEACVQRICTDLVDLLDPVCISVLGKFTARGGIPIWPTAHYVKKNEG